MIKLILPLVLYSLVASIGGAALVYGGVLAALLSSLLAVAASAKTVEAFEGVRR